MFDDKLYRVCIDLARAKSQSGQSYGSLIIKDGSLIGLGVNRWIAKRDGKPRLERMVRQGYANHAEIESLNSALYNYPELVKGADLYCAGFLENNQLLIYNNDPVYTCTLCPKKLQEYGIATISVPTIHGWAKLPMKEAIESAQYFKKGKKDGIAKKRREVAHGDVPQELIKPYKEISFDKRMLPKIS